MAAKHTWKLPLQICYNDAGWQKLENDGATCDGWCANDIACADGYCFGCYGISMCAGAGGRRLLEAPPPASKSTEVHVPGRNLAECEDATDGLVATLSEEALGRTHPLVVRRGEARRRLRARAGEDALPADVRPVRRARLAGGRDEPPLAR